MYRSKRWKIVLLLVCASSLASGLAAQTRFTIDLDVDCEDVELRTLARSFFSRELRDLGDVRVTETSTPDYRVEAIAIKEKRSWVMSVVITAAIDDSTTADLDPESVTALVGYTRTLRHSLMRGDSSGDLGRQIGLIARELDDEVLKPRRKAGV